MPTPPSKPPQLRGTTQPLSHIRKIIAQRMVGSLQTSAQLTTVVEVDVSELAALRREVKDDVLRRTGVKLSYLPFIVSAAIDALRDNPVINASLDDAGDTVTYHDAEHVAIAVDTPRGLYAPVVRHAGDLGLLALAREISDIAQRARTNTLSPDQLSGGTFTVTNIGSGGALLDTPIINQPQVAILGTGAVVERPGMVTDPATGERSIAVRSLMYLVLTYDHRLIDGADASRYLSDLKRRLETLELDLDSIEPRENAS